MKRLKNWVVSLGMAGSLLLSVATPRQVMALDEAAVLEHLTGIPVFTLMDNKGNLITDRVKDAQQQERQVLLFFLNHQDALQELAIFQEARPEDSKNVGIRLMSMRDVLEGIAKIEDSSKLIYQIKPGDKQLKSAENLLVSSGQLVVKDGQLVTKTGQKFTPGLPLFFPTFIGENGQRRVLQLTKETEVEGKLTTETFVPFYMSKSDLEQQLQRLIEDPSEQKIEVGVMMFSRFLAELRNAKTKEEVPFRVFPSNESSQFVNGLLRQAAQKQPATPAPQTN